MKKTFLYIALAAAALTFVACEKKEEKTEVKHEHTIAAEKNHADEHNTATHTEAKTAENKAVEAAPGAEKVEVNKADAPHNQQPAEANDNMPKMQNEQPASNENK